MLYLKNRCTRNVPSVSSASLRSSFVSVIPFVLFFLSGVSGLIYEVVWSRMLVLVIGNTSLATSTILAAFMAGLSLGSYYWGRYIESSASRPLAVFGYLETGVGMLAMLYPLLISKIVPFELWIAGTALQGYALQSVLRFLFCFILLIGPTFLMGGTFAVIGQYIIKDVRKDCRNTALLYGINTAGAVSGAFLAGFF